MENAFASTAIKKTTITDIGNWQTGPHDDKHFVWVIFKRYYTNQDNVGVDATSLNLVEDEDDAKPTTNSVKFSKFLTLEKLQGEIRELSKNEAGNPAIARLQELAEACPDYQTEPGPGAPDVGTP